MVPAVVALAIAALALPAGCGGSANELTPDEHGQIRFGMTMDEVEGIAGAPERTHRTGTAKAPLVYWYYPKTEGEGLVRIAFDNGKLTSISPYEEGVSPEDA